MLILGCQNHLADALEPDLSAALCFVVVGDFQILLYLSGFPFCLRKELKFRKWHSTGGSEAAGAALCSGAPAKVLPGLQCRTQKLPMCKRKTGPEPTTCYLRKESRRLVKHLVMFVELLWFIQENLHLNLIKLHAIMSR